MSFGLIATGFALLMNPVINVFDVIPDLVGFLLIVAGLSKLSYFVGDIERAKSFYTYLAYSEIAKLASIFFVVKSVSSGSTKVLLAFVFSIGQAALFIPATIWLFEGLAMSAVRFHGTKTNEIIEIHGKKKDKAVLTRNFIIAFYVLRCLMTLVPELTELQMYEYVGTVTAGSRPLIYYKPALYVLCGIVVIVVGIIYIVKECTYFTSLSTDKVYVSTFASQFEELKGTRKGLFLSKRMKLCLRLFAFSALLSYLMIIDNINILVGAFSSVFIIVSAILMKPYVDKAMAVIPLAFARLAASVVSFILQINYFDYYNVASAEWVDRATKQYNIMSAACLVEYILALATFVLYTILILKSVGSHLGLVGVKVENAQYSKSARDRETHKVILGRTVLEILFAGIALISSSLFRFIVKDNEMFIVVNSVLNILFIVVSFYYTAQLNTHIYDKELD